MKKLYKCFCCSGNISCPHTHRVIKSCFFFSLEITKNKKITSSQWTRPYHIWCTNFVFFLYTFIYLEASVRICFYLFSARVSVCHLCCGRSMSNVRNKQIQNAWLSSSRFFVLAEEIIVSSLLEAKFTLDLETWAYLSAPY